MHMSDLILHGPCLQLFGDVEELKAQLNTTVGEVGFGIVHFPVSSWRAFEGAREVYDKYQCACLLSLWTLNSMWPSQTHSFCCFGEH